MTLEHQIPRNALVWIIIAQFVLLLPHLARVPIWMVLIYLYAAYWRSMVYQGRWSFPSKLVKVALTLSCFAGVGYSYRSLIGLEPTVALLLTAFALKLLEASERKDAYVLLFLGYFVCITEFLFSQEILTTLYLLFAVLVVTTALVALHQPGQDVFSRSTMKRSSVMLAQAFPLMLVLFFVFPRIGPLWSVPLKAHTAKSGVSDFMSPGDISNLSLSDEVAFRVQFKGEVPERSELYWRGLVFSNLQGNAWRSLRWKEVPIMERRQRRPLLVGDPVEYSVIMEPTQQNWLYGIRYPQSYDKGLLTTNDFRLVSPNEIQDQRRYTVRTWLDAQLEPEISEWRREVDTALPLFQNPRTRDMAEALYNSVGREPEAMVNEMLAMFQDQDFYYTLQPPLLGDNAVDEFLFETRRGFCEHYAAAAAFMLRSVGIPTRVVAGYQGGEVNPVNGTVVVHQFDAHAWNEVWLEGRGWVRLDPTAAIAPERIEYGLERALLEEGSFLANSPLSPLRYRNIAWVNRLRLQLDAINYSWQLFVLNYNSEQQYSMLSRWIGEVSIARIATLLGAVWAIVIIPIAFALFRRDGRSRLDPATRLYIEFCRRLQRIELGRQRSEGPTACAQRIADARPDLAAQVHSITGLYDRLSYRSSATTSRSAEEALELLRKQVKAFRPG